MSWREIWIGFPVDVVYPSSPFHSSVAFPLLLLLLLVPLYSS
jgi:hypothetical protein